MPCLQGQHNTKIIMCVIGLITLVAFLKTQYSIHNIMLGSFHQREDCNSRIGTLQAQITKYSEDIEGLLVKVKAKEAQASMSSNPDNRKAIQYKLDAVGAVQSADQTKEKTMDSMYIKPPDHPALSGPLFKGNKIRKWEPSSAGDQVKRPVVSADFKFDTNPQQSCKYPVVAVTTTISNDLLVIKDMQKETSTRKIPLIVSGDTKGPTLSKLESYLGFKVLKYNAKTIRQESAKGKVYLITLEDQNTLFPDLSKISPVSHFGRKNLGYLAAVAMGACSIWDFDDDNFPRDYNFFDEDYVKSMEQLSPFTIHSPKSMGINPYVLFGATLDKDTPTQVSPIWPRGIPITDKVKEEMPTLHATDLLDKSASIRGQFKTGIVQSLADHDPDVDAIYRLTSSLPVTFKSQIITATIHPAQYTPFNGQATLFHKPAFWGMYLPVTVLGRVSDIWRSYITQVLMRCTGYTLMFHKPAVFQDRNAHNYQGDFNAELPLYQQTEALYKSLDAFSCPSQQLTKCLKLLYIDLYERNILQALDVVNIEKWIATMLAMGYKFPSMRPELCLPSSGREGMFQIKAPQDLSKRIKPSNSFNNTLVVVQMDKGDIELIPLWISIFQHLLPRAIFYAPGSAKCHSMATKDLHCISTDRHGSFSYESMAHAMHNYPKYMSYIATGDKNIFNPMLAEKSYNLRMSVGQQLEHGETHSQSDSSKSVILNKLKNAILPLRSRGRDIEMPNKCLRLTLPSSSLVSDTYVINKKDYTLFQVATTIFRSYNVSEEVAIPWTMSCALATSINHDIKLKLFKYMIRKSLPSVEDFFKTDYCQAVRRALLSKDNPVGQVFISSQSLLGNSTNQLQTLILRHCSLNY